MVAYGRCNGILGWTHNHHFHHPGGEWGVSMPYWGYVWCFNYPLTIIGGHSAMDASPIRHIAQILTWFSWVVILLGGCRTRSWDWSTLTKPMPCRILVSYHQCFLAPNSNTTKFQKYSDTLALLGRIGWYSRKPLTRAPPLKFPTSNS